MTGLRTLSLMLSIATILVSAAPAALAEPAGGGAAADGQESDGHAGGEHKPHPGQGNINPKSLADPAEFRPDLAVGTFVLFLVLMAILSKFAWPPISKALLEREEKIANNIASAENLNADAKHLVAQHQAKLDAAANDVREMLEEARRDAEHTKEQIVTQAKEAAAAEHKRGKAELERATESAMQQMAKHTAQMAVSLAGKVVREDLSTEQKSRVMQDALDKFGNASIN